MNGLDPGIARKVAIAAQQVTVTKNLMERAKTFDERLILQGQLEQHEQALQALQNEVRGTWGR